MSRPPEPRNRTRPTQLERRIERLRHGRSERGIALVWLSMFLLVLMAFAGLAVDLSNWYLHADRLQRAADSAAHAGAVFLPGDAPSAVTTARTEAARNGFNDGIVSGTPNATVTVNQEPNPNRLRVKVDSPINTFFVHLLGINSVDIEREAVAEFVSAVPMGSPENKVGNDPENGYNAVQFWVNIAGRNATKRSGDRYAAGVCSSSVANCTGAANPGIDNDDYSYDGYFFTVDVKNIVPGQPLRFDAFDAAMIYVNDHCTHRMPNAGELTTLSAWYPDAVTRYASGDGPWCNGDQRINSGLDTQTTFIVRGPDNTPWSDTDNPVVSQCSPLTTPYYGTSSTDGDPSVYQWLHPGDGIEDAQAVMDPNDGTFTFAEYFRRWITYCEIPAGSVQTGQYVVQIRTNANSGNPTAYDSSMNQGGHNRMALRVGFGQAGVDAADGSDVAFFARGKLPIYANANAANTTFYLARITPNDAGRTLRITLFDMGDASQAGTLQILPPAEYASTISGCTFARDDGGSLSYSGSTCELYNVSAGNGFNGRIVDVDIPIPEDYTCSIASATGCWFRVLADFPSVVQDTTTWSATILGNPVRLVE